ncbi:response regulator [Candidatus Sumerlaeota bacterium]|nr:response regulator [Candidatus Sumerlaeota bacterium]
MIADDEPMLRSVIGDFLATLDFCRTAQVHDGVEALEYIRSHRVDCILSDMRMPRMDFDELIQVLKREFPALAVLATSGYGDVESARKALCDGADDFLAKPLDLDVLELSIRRVLARRRILEVAAACVAPDSGASKGANGSGSARRSSQGTTRWGRSGGWRELFDLLAEPGDLEDDPFLPLMLHARRTADLAWIVAKDEDPLALNRLRYSAVLHEIGTAACQLQVLSVPRRLNPDELSLVRTQAVVGGRMLKREIPDPMIGNIVARHLCWRQYEAGEEDSWDTTLRLSCILGVINVVDSLFQDRPFRRRLGFEKARATIEAFYSSRHLCALEKVLASWDEIAAYYAEDGPREAGPSRGTLAACDAP